jgi:signal transduction histidine kinase
VTSVRDLLRRVGGDALVVVLLVAAEIEVWSSLERSRWTAALIAPLWTLPLLLRRWSGMAPLLLVGVSAAESFVYYPATNSPIVFVAVLWAFLILGLHETGARALAGGIVGFGLVLVIFSQDPNGLSAPAVISASVVTFGPLAAGVLVRERTHRTVRLAEQARRLERAREEAERVATAEERARIAGELHDVIARAIEVMAVEADAARLLVDRDPDRARPPIEAVEAAGREALAETRRLLGILRRDMAPDSLETTIEDDGDVPTFELEGAQDG